MGFQKNVSPPVAEVEQNWPQITTIFIGALAGLSNGLLFSWPSPFLVKIAQDKVNYNISEEEGAYFSIIQPISMMIACPIFAILADHFGRKVALLLIVVPQLFSWLLAGFAKSVYVFYAARFLSGLSDGCLFVTLPMYIGEVANPTVRGTWGNLLPISYYIGEFLINVIGSKFDTRVTTYICLPLPILYLILFSLMPESPYYYIMKGKEEEAIKSLKFLKRMKNVDSIYKQLKFDVERQLSERGTWVDMIKIKSNRKGLIAGMFLRLSQQLSGFTVFLTFTQLIFQKSGGNVSHEVSSILYLGSSLILNLIGVFLIVPFFNRLTCFVTSNSASGVILFLMSAYIYIDDNTSVDLSSFKWMPLTFMILYQVFTSFGLSLIPTLMLSELYSTSIKSKAMVILSITFGLGIFVASTIFYQMNIHLGFYSPFLFFSACCCVSAILSYYVIPETRGKTLEEIQQMLKKN
ncbi:unnamed protein product [Phyllotreta striolata]|uniref:Major facilitator superfamily (MFS) profile domain-containing protein n=1 Tax=Phyllotreta striolata TaxID=444603 RepID=A0A9N9TNP4_PHYSR|nr:unnamed protein product [Phyllotreta striolata]